MLFGADGEFTVDVREDLNKSRSKLRRYGIMPEESEDINKISLVEKAAHEGNYTEKDLFNLYKRFQFSINQLLTIKESFKSLSNIEARALIYQGILITSETQKKIEFN